MRIKRRIQRVVCLAGLACLVALNVAVAPGLAQTRSKLSDRVKELATQTEEALKGAADGTAALKGLQDLQTKVTGLEQEISRLDGVSRGYEEARTRLAQLQSRIDDLELALGAIKIQLAGRVPTSGYNDGFFVQSEDRKFLLRVGGLVQAGFFGSQFSEERLGSGAVLSENRSSFDLRRARLGLAGHLFSWRLSYRVELDFGPLDPGPLLEAWGDIHGHRAFKLRVGRQKVPLGRQFLVHSAYQQFADRSGAVMSFAPGWDLGALVRGDLPVLGLLSYQVGIFNGAGSTVLSDENEDFLYVARVVFQPLGPIPYTDGKLVDNSIKVALGGAFSYNLARTDNALRKGITDSVEAVPYNDVDSDGRVDNVGIYTAAAELTVKKGPLSLQSELFYRREDPGAVEPEDRKYWGVYGQASLSLLDDSVELAARYGYWEPNYFGMERETIRPQSIHEAAAVLNILRWERKIKLQLEYAHQWQRDLANREQELDLNITANMVRWQMQFAF